MSAFDICTFEDFVSEATPQPGSLEEAASTQEILIQQLERYFNRMKTALCADVNTLQATIDALVPQALPNLVAGVEVASGRQVLGADSFFKLIDLGGLPLLAASPKLVAHGIARPFRVVHWWGAANDPTGGAELTVQLGFTTTGVNNTTDIMLFITTTDISINVGVNRNGFTQAYVTLEYIKS